MSVPKAYRSILLILLFLLANLPAEKSGESLSLAGDNGFEWLTETSLESDLSEASPLPQGLHFDVILYEKKEGSDEEYQFGKKLEKTVDTGFLALTPLFLALLSKLPTGKNHFLQDISVVLQRHIRFRALLI